MESIMRFEVKNPVIYVGNCSTEEFGRLYTINLSVGSNASHSSVTGGYRIKTFIDAIRELEKNGYKNLQFCNGGDDDILVIDHKRKEFGFFEDNVPPLEGNSLQEIWEKQ